MSEVGARSRSRSSVLAHLASANRRVWRRIRDRLKLVLPRIQGNRSLRDVAGDLVPTLKPRAQRPRSPVHYSADAAAVVLSPHRDDAVLSCWSVLASRFDLVVVNVFAGAPPPGPVTSWDRFTGASDSVVRTQERLREDEEALAMAGRRLVNLSFLERHYRRRSPSVATLVSALADHLPRVSRVYAPACIGGHVDHLLARDMAKAISRQGVPVELYAELPYAITYGWPAWVTGSPPDPYLVVDADWEPYLASAPWPTGALSADVRKLSDEEAAAKLRALRAYRTQYSALTGGQRDTLADPLVLRFEVLWRVVDEGGR